MFETNDDFSPVDEYNNIFKEINNMQSAVDVIELNKRLQRYNSKFGEFDITATHRLNERYDNAVQLLLESQENAYNSAQNEVEALKAEYYTPKKRIDESAVSARTIALISQMPAQLTDTNKDRVSSLLGHAVDEGQVGASAVMKLCEMPVYAAMVNANIRQKAYGASKTTEQIRWEENHNARLEAANHKMALAFNEGFKLRTAVKSINKSKSAYFTN